MHRSIVGAGASLDGACLTRGHIVVSSDEAARLAGPKLGIEPASSNQGIVGAFLDDSSLVDDDQPVERGNGGKAMRDGEHGLTLHDPAEVGLDRFFHFRIERRGRLVEDEDRCILQHDARNGDALPLPAGKLHAALADMRLETLASLLILQPFDEFERFGPPRSVNQPFLAPHRVCRRGYCPSPSGAAATYPG